MKFKTKKQQERYKKLVPNDIPRYIRCYDNGGASIDQYTVVMTGHYNKKTSGGYWYLGMSSNPFHPQGVGTTGESNHIIDYPSYKHLGKKIKYEDLPIPCRRYVMETYLYLWDFTNENGRVLN